MPLIVRRVKTLSEEPEGNLVAEFEGRPIGCESISLTLPADGGDVVDLFKTVGYRVLGWELERRLK